MGTTDTHCGTRWSVRWLGDARVGWTNLILLSAGAILALEPALWLVQTWRDPAYDSFGYLVFATAVGLFIWSVSSRPLTVARASRRRAAVALLLASGAARLVSQLIAVNMIGALCLVADVYAIGLLCRLDRRARAISPAWLAILFAFSLPVERVLQRSLGYLLQELSADGACMILSLIYPDLTCDGVRLVLEGTDILVDLPCSGARTLLLGLLGFTVAASLSRPSLPLALLGGLLTLVTAGLANMIRIAVLAIGIAEPQRLGGISVMAQPWHDIIGLGALLLVYLAVTAWMRRAWTPVPTRCPVFDVPLGTLPARLGRDGDWLVGGLPVPRLQVAAALLALGAALVIVSLPRTPLDVSAKAVPRQLPVVIDGLRRQDADLSPRETVFFTRYGGWAAKAQYGAHGLMLVRTTSPLRHLHTPDDCLRGLGFEVAYLGLTFDPVPTAIYRATSPRGHVYRIDVSFVSDKGAITTNVATAVWLWLTGEARAWTAGQRISPLAPTPRAHVRFGRNALAALDIHLVPDNSSSRGPLSR